MANPQKENGYTAIANEILEHLSLPGISGSEFRVILFVIRKTYGYNKKKDKISLSQFQKGTLMNRAQAVRTIHELVFKRILVKDGNVYKFNKNWEEWVVSKRIPSIQTDTIASIQLDTKTSIQKDTHKRKKDNITKDNIAEQAPQAPFSWNEYLQRMDNHKARHVQVIAFYFKKKGIKYDTQPKAASAIKRHLRAAKEVANFSDEEIVRAYKTCDKEYKEIYTIETLLKVLTR